ncbi:hypothetical protein ACFX11_035415 [Malus domestica]
MKNHQARPTGATDVPKAHYSTNQRPKHHKWCGRGSQKPPCQGQQSHNLSKGGNKAKKRPNLALKAPSFNNKGKAPEIMDADM